MVNRALAEQLERVTGDLERMTGCVNGMIDQMTYALNRLSEERDAAEQCQNIVEKNYRLGLCDGVQETICALSENLSVLVTK